MTTNPSSGIQSLPNEKEIWDGVYAASCNKPNAEIIWTPSPPFKSEGARWRARLKLYKYRKKSRYIYPKDHPNYGSSIFDLFEITDILDHNGDLALKFTKTIIGGTIRAGDYEITLDTTQPNSNE